MQGVGNPHTAAKIQTGDAVLDLGSGLGVDALIAANAAGDAGRVVGLEISRDEVAAAEELRASRKVSNVSYILGDMEQIPAPNSSFDVVISNGGFCLVPDKEKAFREIQRVLKPGGRVSIWCTTNRVDLSKEDGDAGVEWPACMRVFMPLDTVASTVEAAGLVDVVVDDTDSKMDVWEVDEDAMASEMAAANDEAACSHARKAAQRRLAELKQLQDARSAERVGVHWGDPRFDHLQRRDVNKLCARVNIIARKPNLSPSAASVRETPSSLSSPAFYGAAATIAVGVVAGLFAFQSRGRLIRARRGIF